MGGGWFSQVTLVFCFGPNPKFCSFDLDLDQAEQYSPLMEVGENKTGTGAWHYSKAQHGTTYLLTLVSSSTEMDATLEKGSTSDGMEDIGIVWT